MTRMTRAALRMTKPNRPSWDSAKRGNRAVNFSSIMSGEIKFTLAQINPTVGAIAGNLAKIIRHCQTARDELASDVVIFPELAVSGYPPEDLLLRHDFLAQCAHSVEQLKSSVHGIVVIVGHPLWEDGKVFNALSVIENGKQRTIYRKRHLPNYTVFDEKRYFHAGREAASVEIKGVRLGLTICEDIWRAGPVKQLADLGADLIVSINASPFHNEQAQQREEGVVLKNARDFRLPIIYLNQVGGQDELVFDGCSLVVNDDGAVAARLPAFCETLETVVLRRGKFVGGRIEARLQGAELIYRAIVLGVRDYIEKNNFKGAVLGLSGGIDSALSLAIAVDAIGKERVAALMMPSRYTSEMSLQDARREAEVLGVRYEVIPIEPIYQPAMAQIKPLQASPTSSPTSLSTGQSADVTEQNIQARCRGLLLMAFSNKFGYMVLTTGNKSEMAVGYATLYGDMVGGFSAIKDVPKMMVYQLARYRNAQSESSLVIPERVITRAPSAELAPDQKDQDTLPPYEILDPILEAFVEHDRSVEQIIAAGYDEATVRCVVKMVVANEYKRRQAAPGVRVTSRAFGKDRRYPITSRFF